MSNFVYNFDRFLKYDELKAFCEDKVTKFPHLCVMDVYGKSYQNRDLFMITITDTSTGAADTKPAHWIDANIHSTEVTSGVAACYLIHNLLEGYSSADKQITKALQTRTFYIVPRVNPDGVEAALGDIPQYFRSSVKHWPYLNGRRFPGILSSDIDGDGRILTMRVKDEHGAWVQHPDEVRVMIPVDHELSPIARGEDVQRYRLLQEGLIENFDGFTIPRPKKIASLDLNRNFPAGWGKEINGSGDHALSEPEIYGLVSAITSRPNICGYNAYHTSGGVLLRPSSTKADSKMDPLDVYVWKEILGKQGTKLTGCPVHSCYEDFTWDQTDCMSGAADDFCYEHLGIYSWTTEFWDVIFHATGKRASTKIWYLGPSVEEEFAICKWADEHAPGLYVHWYAFMHPQLGEIEIGGCDSFRLSSNPPLHMLREEVKGHAAFAVFQAMLSPKLEILTATAEEIAPANVPSCSSSDIDKLFLWRVKVGVANTGFLPTNVTALANKIKAVLPVLVEISTANEGEIIASADGHSALCQQAPGSGQLEGRLGTRVDWSGTDGTPDRFMAVFYITAKKNICIKAVARHQRAGKCEIVFSTSTTI